MSTGAAQQSGRRNRYRAQKPRGLDSQRAAEDSTAKPHRTIKGNREGTRAERQYEREEAMPPVTATGQSKRAKVRSRSTRAASIGGSSFRGEYGGSDFHISILPKGVAICRKSPQGAG